MSNKRDTVDARDELLKEIEKLETPGWSATKTDLPKTTLDEIKYERPTDEALGKTAESELSSYKTEGEKSVRDSAEAQNQALVDKRDAYATSRDGEVSALDEQYRSAVRAVDNDVVRRGLARSSIAVVERAELEREYLSRNADIASSYGKKLAELDGEIAAYDSKLKKALDDFNLAYAAKLNQRITELKTERDKKEQEVLKYNNEVKKSQAKLDSDRAKDEYALYKAALDIEQQQNSMSGLPSERVNETYKAIYDAMDKFLGSMDKDDAMVELLNHSLYRQHLSNYYYNRLLDKYGRI